MGKKLLYSILVITILPQSFLGISCKEEKPNHTIRKPILLSEANPRTKFFKKYPLKHPDVAYHEADGVGIMVLPTKGEVKVLNETGFRVFQLLDGKHTPEKIADIISQEFEVEYEVALSDIYDFLIELEENEMLADEN